MIKKILSVASAITLLGGLVAGAMTYDSTLAKDDNVKIMIYAVESKLDIYLIDQELADIRKQQYEIRARWAPEYKRENNHAYESIDHLLDFIKTKDQYDYDRYIELKERKKELEIQKEKIKETLT